MAAINIRTARKQITRSRDNFKMPEHIPVPSPARAVYGYSAYLVASTLGILYGLWALLPTDLLGLHYLPDKYLSLCLPNVITVGFMLFIFCLYPALNSMMAAEVDDLASVVDPNYLCQQLGSAVPIWQPIKQRTTSPNSGTAKSGAVGGPCAFCNEWHGSVEPKQMAKPISAAQFTDIAEVNRLLFD